MVQQTSIQKSAAIRLGSAKFEFGASTAALTDLGAMLGVKMTEEWEEIWLETDNAGDELLGITNQKLTIEGDMLETDLINLYSLRGGIDTNSTIAASEVTITDESKTLTTATLCKLTYKNGAGTQVSTIVVTNSAGAITYTEATDYEIIVDANGYTNLVLIDGAGITSGDTILVDYKYTPYASYTLKTGGLRTIASKVARLTNENASGKILRLTLYKAYNTKGIEMEFQPDRSADANKIHIVLKAVCDVTRGDGDQLCEIYDEQSTT